MAPQFEHTQFYTGIGSREAPPWALELATDIARAMARRGLILRHGDAGGMDEHFGLGADALVEAWAPWPNFRVREKRTTAPQLLQTEDEQIRCGEFLVKQKIAPYFFKSKQSVQALFARNVYQITGRWNPDGSTQPLSRVVVYWAPEDRNGVVEGGTRIAVYTARCLGVPTVNLALPNQAVPFLEELGLPYTPGGWDDAPVVQYPTS